MDHPVQSRPTAGCGCGSNVRKFDPGVPEGPEEKAGLVGGIKGGWALPRRGHVGPGKFKLICQHLSIYNISI